MSRVIPSLVSLAAYCLALVAAPGDWSEPRQNAHLTSVQPVPGRMTSTPEIVARFDLGRSQPAVIPVNRPGSESPLGLCIVAGALSCYDAGGALVWTCHPPGLNFSTIASMQDFDGDGKVEIALQAGRTAEPFGAAVLVSLETGELLWRYDVEPMSYAWYLSAGRYLPGDAGQQLVVLMQGYPPDKDNGYIVLFEFPEKSGGPVQKWRYDFSEYTCFPSLLQADLEGDNVDELVVETHSRMWFLDAATGVLKQFVKWDVSPANCRSYGFIEFVDLNADGLEDFLCIANFAQHHEVLLNNKGVMEKAWSHGWPEKCTATMTFGSRPTRSAIANFSTSASALML